MQPHHLIRRGLAGFAASAVFTLAGFSSSLLAHQHPQASTERLNTDLFVSQITEQNAASLIRQGPDAIGGIGDWFLSNGTLCAIVSGVEHESEFSRNGGSLIDLGFCGRADDHFLFSNDLVDGDRNKPFDARSVSMNITPQQASIIVQSSAQAAKLTTTFSLNRQTPSQLHIDKSYQATEEDAFDFVSPMTFNYHSLEAFVFDSRDPKRSNGFQNQDFVSRGISAIGDSARHADTIITVSPRDAHNGIAYGWRLAKAERVDATQRIAVPFFMLADESSTAMMVLTDTFYIGSGEKVGWLQLPQIPLLGLDPQQTLETQEIIYVGQRGDAASVTDQLLAEAITVSGKVGEVNSALHIRHRNGSPLTHVQPNSDGSFTFKAPPGQYTLKALAYAGRESRTEFTAKPGEDLDLGSLSLPAAARVLLPQGEAMRLVFVGLKRTERPDFAGNLTEFSVTRDDGEHFPERVHNVFLAGVAGDKTDIELAAGHYRVYATRGPEYSLEKTDINVSKGSVIELDIAIPQRLISTPNYIASDLHVHSGLSFDNTFAEAERVRTFVAEHGEVMVASEHDLPVDYRPYIKAMKVESQITAIPAAEVTSLLTTKLNPYTGGHANFFPYEPSPHAYRRGMVNHENQRLRDTIHAVRKIQPDVLVQLNHPRYDLRLSGKKLPSDWEDVIDNGNYLDHMGSAAHPYNPHQTLDTAPNNTLIEPDPETGLRDLDFDLIEVINPGGKDNYQDRLSAVRRDWLSFLKQGERIVGTANSDSHNAHQRVAIPRTMVAMDDDRVSAFKQDEFIAALKAGRTYGTTGPMLNVSFMGKSMGETFEGERGTISVEVQRVPWINVDRLEIQINGDTIDVHNLQDKLRQNVLIPLEFNKDSFVTVEVFGSATEDYSNVYPKLAPYAFSNPIYVDYDADGKWQAPGL